MSTDPALFLIDVSGFVFRAYHALPSLTNSRGVPTGAVLGFCNMVFRLIEDHKPTHLAAVFDSGRPSFRKEIYADYKANRPAAPEDLVPQFGLVERFVDGARIARVVQPGFEADDVIATLARRAQARGIPVTIVSSDKDLMQLVGERIVLLDTMKEKRFGIEQVVERFGVSPEQLGDWLALVGDSSDNIPGVPGVGPKTATTLLQQYGSIERLLAELASIKRAKLRENLERNAEMLGLSRKLVALVEDCPLSLELEQLEVQDLDRPALWKLFGELEFTRLRPKVAPLDVIDRALYQTVSDVEQLDRVFEQIAQAGELSLDLETTGIDPMRADIVGIALCWAAGEAAYVPVAHRYLGVPKQLPLGTVLERLMRLTREHPLLRLCAQNHKYDWVVLARHGLELKAADADPMLASYVIDPARQTHNLDALAQSYLGHTMEKFAEVAGKRDTFEMVEVDRATRYAAEDAEVALLLARQLEQKVAQDAKLSELYRRVELPLAAVLARIERRGCLLDCDVLAELEREVSLQLAELLEGIQEDAGWAINPNSPKQLQKLLFEQLELSTGRKTKTGFSTDADVLSDLALEHPIAARIEEWRSLAKLKSAYLDSLPKLIHPKTGRVHTSFNQAVAATGRLSSSDPNLQNIPVRGEIGRRIREAFIAPAGRAIVSADYSQIELRILAHLSGDPVLRDAFAKGQDVHTRTAAEVFAVPADSVTAEQRRIAKAVNFGVIYGQTDWGLARQLRIPKFQAAQYIEGYFARYAGVQAFMERTIEAARTDGYVTTLFGRRRTLADIRARRRGPRLYAERMARNTPIQGSAADIIKLAMIAVERALEQSALDAQMILTVHDELVFETAADQVDALADLVRQIMSEAAEVSVPLVVDVGSGANWGEAH
ncbi:MAG: DNA polymerase I [Deltaproteobacteria bacterium]|nr:DNA polymerase I [Deltaproteobacteria bacterium]